MKRIAILTRDDFTNDDITAQTVFQSSEKAKMPFNEADFEVIIFEGQVIANRYGETGDLSTLDLDKLLKG